MDDKTLLAIIRRIDDAERRLIARIDRLEEFKAKVIGGALVISAFVSLTFQILKK